MMKAMLLAMMIVSALTGWTAALAPAAQAATGSAALWGINYSQVRVHIWGKNTTTGVRFDNDVLTANPVFSGKGELVPLTAGSYVFRVPDDQVLVINQIEGQGVIFINGYGAQAYGAPLSVQYVFGPGELVGIRFAPVVTGSGKVTNKKYYDRHDTSYSRLHISGYLADPSLFNGAGGKLAK